MRIDAEVTRNRQRTTSRCGTAVRQQRSLLALLLCIAAWNLHGSHVNTSSPILQVRQQRLMEVCSWPRFMFPAPLFALTPGSGLSFPFALLSQSFSSLRPLHVQSGVALMQRDGWTDYWPHYSPRGTHQRYWGGGAGSTIYSGRPWSQ